MGSQSPYRGIKGRVQRNTVANRGWQGRTGGVRSLQWYTGDVYRAAQGMVGYTRALYSGTQGMYRDDSENTGDDRN